MGEEIDLEKSQSSDSFSLKSSSLFIQAAKLHGSHQDSSETSSSSTGVNHAFSSRTDYDKLCLSLLCGLPNEQELALNVCTILSNEGNYMLHLEQTPKLIDLLVAQTGVFPLGDDQIKMLYLESWNNLKGRNMHKFWRSTLDGENMQLMDLLQLDLGAYDPHCKLLNLETELGAHNVEGQRVLRIALVLHNLSFEKNNVLPLVSSRNFMRFMLLCIHSSWGNLKQVAYDTLSNLASAIKISIEKDVYSRLIFRTVVNGILSCDRYMNVRSLDILAQLCSHEANEDVLPTLLEVEVYQRMVSFLTVRDIMLLIYTLETLYALSDLGRYACDKIVSVHRCIGALVSLLTLEPAEYGPAGQIKMKVVKTLVPADADSETDCTGTVVEETPISETTSVTTSTTITTTTTSTNIIEPVDSEGFAINWLKSTYEASPGNSVSRNEIYSDYLTTCTKTGRKDIVNANVFAEYVKKAFPMCGVKKCESKGIITFHHDGLQKKGSGPKIIVSVSSPSVTTSMSKVITPTTPVSCKPPQKTTFNSILKSQLSSAPKVVSTTPVKNPTQILSSQKLQTSPQSQTVQQRAVVSSTSSNAGSSTLIKSLLASKVQQRNLQSQVVPSNVSKMVIYSPGGSGLLGPHTTVVRCIRPGLHTVNLGTQIRSSLPTCLVSNGATRIITNASPRFVKNTTVIRHALQPQMIKQGIVSTSRINGLQRDLQVVDDENFKATSSTQLTQVVQMNTQSNQQVSQIQQGQVNTQQNQVNTQQNLPIQVNNQQSHQVLKTQVKVQQNQQTLQTSPVQANNQQNQQVLTQQIQVNSNQQNQVLQTQQIQTSTSQTQQILQNLQSQINAPQNHQLLQNIQNQLNSSQNQQLLQNLQNQLNAPQNQQILQSLQSQLTAPQNQLLQNLQNQLNAPQNQQILHHLQNQINVPQNQQVLQSQVSAPQNQQILQNLQSQINSTQNQQILQSQGNSQNQILQNLQSQGNLQTQQTLQSQANIQQNQQIVQSQQVQLSNQQNQQVLQNLQSQLNTSQNQINASQNQQIFQTLQNRISSPQNQHVLQSQSQVQLNNQQNQVLQTQQIQSTSLQNQVFHSHLIQVNNQQSQQVLQNATCSQSSVLPNGDNLQLIKNINTNNDSNLNYVPVIQNSELLKLIGGKDLTQSEIPLLINSKPLHDDKTVKETNLANITFEIKKDPLPSISVEQPEIQSQKTLSSPTSILKSVLSDLDIPTDEIKRQQQQKDILRRAPLLNGLLDKGKLPLQSSVSSNTFLLNGTESTAMEIVSPKESKPTQFVQLNQNSFVIPVSSFNTVMSNPQSNLILMPVSSMNPVISSPQLNSGIPVFSSSQLNSGIPIISSSQLNSNIPVISSSQLSSGISVISSSQLNSGIPVINSPPLNSGVLTTSPVNSNATFISSSTSTVQLSVPNPVIPSNATFLSNGSNLMQLCIGQTTLSGTVEVQSDQQGVVRLHIESPENSNQGSDLSSISDITRTLECASKALLKTNAECSTQVSFSDVCETAAPTVVTTTITTTSPSALTRTGQQFFVVTPTINQPQIQIQQPNFKFHILHSIPKIEESVDLVSFPNINISQSNQLQLPSSETSSASTTSLKRPSSDSSTQLNIPAAKKPCMDSKILSESLRTPTSVPCTVDSLSVSAKSHLDTKSLILKSSQTENIEAMSRLTTPKTVIKHAPKSELSNDKGNRTFSGLSSVNTNQTNIAVSQAPQKSTVEMEFLCEWKNCGLKFQSPSSVFLHASKSHAPLNSNDLVCSWEGCDSIKRRRLSHLTHLQDWHCNESILQNQALRRKQIAQTGKSSIPPPQKPPLHPGYAPDAALLAIKRHALQYINPKELSEEKESVLTKSIRLTSALILRNLVTHSNLARTYLRRFEADIAYLAMSPVESARTLAQCLSQLHTTHD